MDEAARFSSPYHTRQPAATTTIDSAPDNPPTRGRASTSYCSERSQHGYPPVTEPISPQTHAHFNLFATIRASQTTLTLPRRTTALSQPNPTGDQKDPRVSAPVPTSILKKRTHQESVTTIAGDGEIASGLGDHEPTSSLNAKRHSRGQPRVRFHPSAGHRGGQLHRSQSNRALATPAETSQANPHQPPLPAFSSGASATPGSVAVKTSTISSCHEKPEYFPRIWPAVSSFAKDRLRSSRANIVIQHSAFSKPCENADKHKAPYLVCTSCHAHATNYIRRMNPSLAEPKWLPLCKSCGSAAVSSILAERAQQGLVNPLMGCRCDCAYLCCECRIGQKELAVAKHQAEGEMRMQLMVVGYVDNVENKCAKWVVGCFCGASLQNGDYLLLQCSGCRGLKYCT